MGGTFKYNKLILSIAFAISIANQAYPQTDSIQKLRQDSLLAEQQAQTTRLLSQADSIRIADSIELEQLQRQIDAIQANNEQARIQLQQRLDSLQAVQEQHELRTRQQVDSLRASTPGIPVLLFGDTLFFIYSRLGPFSPSDRASTISEKLESLVDQHLFDPELLVVVEGEETHDVMHDDIIILSITDRDGFWMDQSRKDVAELYMESIIQSIEDYRKRNSLFQIFKRVGLLVLVLLLFFFGIKHMNRVFTWVTGWFLLQSKLYIKGIKIRNYELLSLEREEQLIRWLLNIVKWITIGIIVYLLLPIVFSIFPATKNIADTLFNYILNPLRSFGSAILGYIPELITIIVVILITHYFIRFLKFLSREVETGKLQLPGFYPDWASPTFNILRIIIYAFAFIVIFPYLPGSDSPVFRGVSVFFGLLISLGSSSAISNIIAGLVITYMRAFKIGDRVKIGDTTGDVIEKTMLVTRLRTIKNENVTIPNSAILNGSTVNYSSSAKAMGLILNSTVTIGYDVPWRKVQDLLINAALKTEHIMQSPQPFVLQTSLDDYYISYQINAYTQNPEMSAKIYSQLHANIQDAFNEAGEEIMSPHYMATRDGNKMAIPGEYLPPNYSPPAFNIKIDKGMDSKESEK